jgi:hypothetical protein
MRLNSNWKKISTAMTLGTGLLLGTSSYVCAQQQPAPTPTPDQREDGREADRNLGEFLGQHPELREQLHKDPNLVNDPKFVADHPDLQKYMQDHPKIADHWKAHPANVMHREQRFAERHDTVAHHPAQKKH